jgi:hypothetical protein
VGVDVEGFVGGATHALFVVEVVVLALWAFCAVSVAKEWFGGGAHLGVGVLFLEIADAFVDVGRCAD